MILRIMKVIARSYQYSHRKRDGGDEILHRPFAPPLVFNLYGNYPGNWKLPFLKPYFVSTIYFQKTLMTANGMTGSTGW